MISLSTLFSPFTLAPTGNIFNHSLPFSGKTKSYAVIDGKTLEQREVMITDSMKQAALDPVMLSFKSSLVKQLGINLKEVWLFGSRPEAISMQTPITM